MSRPLSPRREAAAPVWGERKRLTALTVPLDTPDPLRLLQLTSGAARIFWRDPRSGITTVGLGAAAVLRADGTARVPRLQLQIDHLFSGADLTGSGPMEAAPRLFGGLSFTAAPRPDPWWASFGPACFVLPHVTVTLTPDSAWLTLCRYEEPAQPGDQQSSLQSEAEAFLAGLAEAPSTRGAPGVVHELCSLLATDDWQRMVQTVVGRIQAGTLKKTVLSRALEAQADAPLDPVAALARLDARFTDTYRFLIEPVGGTAFIGATPELLAEVHESVLHTAALAGSRPRGATPDEDQALADDLMRSAKEREEHQVVVESVLARIAPYAREVTADSTPQILRLRNIQHLYTPISATLESHFGALDLVAELHPTPALGGFPQRPALAAIQELEPFERGWFASPVGWVDARGDGVFAVAIRSAVVAGARARLYAGAGIVAASVAAQEWEETGLKFRPLLMALGAEGTV